VKLGTKCVNFHVGSLPKFYLESDMKIDQIRISDIANLKNDHLNSSQYFGHNSLKTGPNDLKFMWLESLDTGLHLL